MRAQLARYAKRTAAKLLPPAEEKSPTPVAEMLT
jgi:hypothetical protein